VIFVGLVIECKKLSDSALGTVDQISALFPDWKKTSVQRKIADTLNGKDDRFVALNEGKIIGHVRVVLGSGVHSHRAEMTSLVVDKSLRHQSIATLLVQYAIKELPKRTKLVLLAVDSSNKNAVGLYKKLGFEQYGFLKKGSVHDGKFRDHALMKKEL